MCPGINGLTKCAPIADWLGRARQLGLSRDVFPVARPQEDPPREETSEAMRRTSQSRRLSLIALALLSSACTANRSPSKIETALANMAKDVVIPIEAETLKNPFPQSEQVTRQGQQMYLQSCALCHGADGHGRTEIGRGMYPPAMDLTSPHVQHWNDAELFWIIRNGVRMTGMPSWKSISDTDSWKLVRFIRDLPELDARAATQAAETERQAKAKQSSE